MNDSYKHGDSRISCLWYVPRKIVDNVIRSVVQYMHQRRRVLRSPSSFDRKWCLSRHIIQAHQSSASGLPTAKPHPEPQTQTKKNYASWDRQHGTLTVWTSGRLQHRIEHWFNKAKGSDMFTFQHSSSLFSVNLATAHTHRCITAVNTTW